MNPKTILRAESLSKKYNKVPAINNISLSIKEGEFCGLLGPNGAGKTTTIKLLIGLVRPDCGKISYGGKDFYSFPKEAKKQIGVVPQQSNLDRDLTAFENLYLHTILHRIPKRERSDRIEEALAYAGLSDYRDKQVKNFSGGMKRRLVIVRALLHQPKLLFLDEPTSGLDPQIRRNLWNLVYQINQEQKTAVLLTTHYIEEAEKLCQRVKIIDAGRIIADDTPNMLKEQLGGFVLEIFDPGKKEDRFFKTEEEARAEMKNAGDRSNIRAVTLEDVFIKLTGRRINV